MSNREFFTQLCASEYPRFLSVLEATPKQNLEYRPHPKSRSAHELVAHLIAHELDLDELLATGTIHHRLEVPFSTVEEAVDIYRKARTSVESRLASARDSDWESIGKFNVMGKVIMEAPRRDLAWMLVLDAIHHRGQLSTYLRPMGGKVPSIYGPTADTQVQTT